jgi:CheY-like chemotaxis protein
MIAPVAKTIILAVDDEALLLLDFEELLIEAGYDVLTAPRADRAIKLLELNPNIGLVITDINMPGLMDGLGLIRVIRQSWPPIKLIIVSGKSRFEPGEVPDDVPIFAKPYIFADVHAKAQELLQSRL